MKRISLIALLLLLAGCSATTGYKDGTFVTEAKGNNGTVEVETVVADGTITSVTVTKNSETKGVADGALTEVPAAIVENNGTDGVDTVSGATYTSKAIIEAVDTALKP